MELQLANKLQHHIADLMWKATDQQQVDAIIKIYGPDAVTVFDMMLAAYFDEVDSVDIVQPIIERIKNGS